MGKGDVWETYTVRRDEWVCGIAVGRVRAN